MSLAPLFFRVRYFCVLPFDDHRIQLRFLLMSNLYVFVGRAPLLPKPLFFAETIEFHLDYKAPSCISRLFLMLYLHPPPVPGITMIFFYILSHFRLLSLSMRLDKCDCARAIDLFFPNWTSVNLFSQVRPLFPTFPSTPLRSQSSPFPSRLFFRDWSDIFFSGAPLLFPYIPIDRISLPAHVPIWAPTGKFHPNDSTPVVFLPHPPPPPPSPPQDNPVRRL